MTEEAENSLQEKDKDLLSKESKNILKSLLPFGLLLILTIVYICSDYFFVQCGGKKICETGIDSSLMSQVKEPVINLSNSNAELSNRLAKLNTEAETVKKANSLKQLREQEIANTESKIVNELAEINKLKESNVNADVTAFQNHIKSSNTRLTTQKEELTFITNNTNSALQNKTSAESDVIALRKHLSSRYAYRIGWIFLSGVFLMLCLAGVVYGGYLILRGYDKWFNTFAFGVTSLISLIFAVIAYLSDENYMSIVKSMYDKSIEAGGDLSLWMVNFINVLGFITTIFLAVGMCAVFYGVDKESAKLVKNFPVLRGRAQTVLYLAAAMLFVGMLRVNTLADWHLAFVSFGQNDEYVNLLREFFKSSISVQAGFYSLLIAAIYLPLAYHIWKADPSEGAAGSTWYTSLSDYFPRILTILSPLIAGPALDVVKYLAGK